MSWLRRLASFFPSVDSRRADSKRSLPYPAAFLLLAAVYGFAAVRPVQAQLLSGSSLSELQSLSGEVVVGDGRCYWVRDLAGNRHCSELVAEVGDRYVVKSPDGALQVIRAADAQRTPLRFVPFNEKELRDHLLKGQYRGGGWKGAIDGQHVYIYKCSEAYLVRAQKIVSTMHANVQDYFRQRQFELKLHVDPMPVVIYDTQENYLKETHVPRSMTAFYTPVLNTIVLFEQPAAGTPAPKMMQQFTLGAVAHEVVHQTFFNVGIEPRLGRWPFWLTEGFPEYLSPSIDLGTGDFVAVGRTNHDRLRVLKLLEGKPIHYQLARGLVSAPSRDGEGYAMAWAYTHYLAQKKTKDFRSYLRTLMQRKPLEAVVKPPPGKNPPDEEMVFLQHFGKLPRDFYTEVVDHVSKLKYRDPAENDAHLVVAIEYVRGGRTARDVRMMYTAELIETAKAVLLKNVPADEKNNAQFRVLEFGRKSEAYRFAEEWVGGAGAIVLD